MKYLRYFVTLCLYLHTCAAWCAKEAYVVVKDSVMTFCYDELRGTHQTNTYTVEPYLHGVPQNEKEQIRQVIFSTSFADARPESTRSWFYGLYLLRQIDGMENLNTSEVTDMSLMFAFCSSLESVDVSRFDTSRVEDMIYMFYSCSSLAELDLSNFTISPGCDTGSMLESCTQLRLLHASSSIGNFSDYSCRYVGEQSPCHIDVPEDFDFGVDTGHGPFLWKWGMFILHDAELPYACQEGDAMTFRYDKNWMVTDLNPIFVNQAEQKTGWIGKGWTKSITSVSFSPSFASYSPISTRRWLDGMSSLMNIEGLEYINTSKAEDMTAMFRGCTAIDTLDLSHFDLSSAKNKNDMLKDCTGLKFLAVSSSMASLPEGACANVGNGSRCIIEAPMGFPFDTDTREAFFDWKGGHFALHGADLSYAIVGDSELAFYRDNRWETQKNLNFLTLNKPEETPAWFPEREKIASVRFTPEFVGARPMSTRQWFKGMKSLERIDGWEYLNTSEVTDMGAMFKDCLSLAEIDLTHFDTSSVTSMGSMFCRCNSLKELDLGSFDTSNVRDMSKMFYCCKMMEIDLGNFNTSNVEDMREMFYAAGFSTLDVSHFDITKAASTEGMFGSGGMRTIKISKTMSNLAEGALSGVGQMLFSFLMVPEGMVIDADTIDGCYRWKGGRFYLPGSDAPYVRVKDDVLEFVVDADWCEHLDSSFPLNERPDSYKGWTPYCKDVRLARISPAFADIKLLSASSMFKDMESLERIEGLEYLNTSEATSMNSMFKNCSRLESLNLSHFDTSEVNNMNNMFYNCHALKSLDLSHFDTSQLKDFNMMFVGCDSLKSLNMTNFQLNIPNGSQVGNIISYLTNLKELYISENLNKCLADDECKNIGSLDSPCILHAPKGLLCDRESTDIFYWKGGVFRWPIIDLTNAQSCPDSNHPHAIDLGLPSGTKWACCNVGTKTPEGYGGYYAWGETEEKEIYDWATYIHCDGSKETCHDIGSDIAGTEYDVAHIQWGCSWVMPSQGQIQELASECSYSWETKNGVWGVLFTGPNGDTIFLPAADNSWISHSYSSVSGYNDDSDCEKDEMPISGYYWSSTQSLSGAGFAYNLLFTDNSVFFDYYHHRNVGFTVRPVISGTSNVIHPKSYSDETSQTVYGISGIKVADTTAGMNALPRGIYIRNGRKYVK